MAPAGSTKTVDQERVKAAAAGLLGIYTGSILTQLIELGTTTGLLEATVAGGTSKEISRRAGLQERYVREWLGGMTTGGLVSYDAESGSYTLPAEHALLLTKGSPRSLAPLSGLLDGLVRHLPAITECFQRGGGVPESAYWPEFSTGLDGTWRTIYDHQLVDGFLSIDPLIVERLESGCRVADVGCGTGHAVNVMAQRFPKSEFVGFDSSAAAIARAVAESRASGCRNAHFEALDIAQLPSDPGFDLVTAFDVIHDLADPFGTLRRIAQALRAGGAFLMVEFKFSSHLEKNLGNPFAALYYGVSLLHCMPVSLEEGGAGLGVLWGTERTREALAEAGLGEVTLHDSPRPQNCVYICRKGR